MFSVYFCIQIFVGLSLLFRFIYKIIRIKVFFLYKTLVEDFQNEQKCHLGGFVKKH